MRQTIIFIFITLFILSGNNSNCCATDKDEYVIEIQVTNESFKSLVIDNNSDENFIIWLAKDVNSLSPERKIKRYFLRRIGDFSLLNLITDEIVFHEPLEMGIYNGFLKIIQPGNKFIIVTDNSSTNYIDNLKEQLVLLPLSLVEQILKIKITNNWSYNPDVLFVP